MVETGATAARTWPEGVSAELVAMPVTEARADLAAMAVPAAMQAMDLEGASTTLAHSRSISEISNNRSQGGGGGRGGAGGVGGLGGPAGVAGAGGIGYDSSGTPISTAASGKDGVNGPNGINGSPGPNGSDGVGSGGGIYNAPAGVLAVKNSSFGGNSANLGPDIDNASTAPVQIKHHHRRYLRAGQPRQRRWKQW